MNLENALSVGAKTVKGPRFFKLSVKSAFSINAANMLKPRILNCSGISFTLVFGSITFGINVKG